jgi:two-component system nitrate/nitrite response regulator NarL
MPMTKSILIADDHPLMTEGLTALIHATTSYKVIGTANNGKTLIQLLNRKQPDLILLDINMPVMDGMQSSELIKNKFPDIKVVVISMYTENGIIQQLHKCNVDGFIPKLTEGSVFVDALNKIMKGKKVFIPSMNHNKRRSPGINNALDVNQLSNREKEILLLIKEGLTSKQIATQLIIKTYTVDTHRKNICRKLQIKSPNALIKFAMNKSF